MRIAIADKRIDAIDPSRYRVLLVHNYYQQPGGEDAVFKAEKLLLQQHGHEVDTFVASNHRLLNLRQKIKAVTTAHYSNDAKNQLTERLLQFRPDIVHVHNHFPLITPAAYDACQALGIPVVQTLHNYRTICPGALLMRDGSVCETCVTKSAYRSVIHACYRDSRMQTLVAAHAVTHHRKNKTWQTKVNRFIALTEFAKNKFAASGFPEHRIAVKPNFITSSTGDMTDFSRNAKSPRRALFVGRLSKEKGVATLLASWRNNSQPLDIVGDGPLAASVRANTNANIVFHGQQTTNRVRQFMAEAAFVIMPSEWFEGLPMVVIEAYAQATPVLASRIGGLAEIVNDGVTGLLFDPGNARDLAEKARWLLSNPDACRKMGENARHEFLEKYNAPRNYQRLLEIYRDARLDPIQ